MRTMIENLEERYLIEKLNYNNTSEILNLHNLKIKNVSKETFRNFENVNTIHLGSNFLKTIDGAIFDSLYNLTTLWLSNNRIINLPSNCFQNLKNLTTLSIAMNRLEEIDESTFNGLDNLTLLYLNNNYLKEIKTNHFSGLKKLREIFLHGNQIKTLGNGVFNDLESIEFLDLSSNMLSKINVNTFKNLFKLKCIHLYKNRFDGNSEMELFIEENVTYFTFKTHFDDNNIKYIKKKVNIYSVNIIAKFSCLKHLFLVT